MDVLVGPHRPRPPGLTALSDLCVGTSQQAAGMPLPAMDGGNAGFAGAKTSQSAAGVPAQLNLEKRCKPDAIRT